MCLAASAAFAGSGSRFPSAAPSVPDHDTHSRSACLPPRHTDNRLRSVHLSHHPVVAPAWSTRAMTTPCLPASPGDSWQQLPLWVQCGRPVYCPGFAVAGSPCIRFLKCLSVEPTTLHARRGMLELTPGAHGCGGKAHSYEPPHTSSCLCQPATSKGPLCPRQYQLRMSSMGLASKLFTSCPEACR